MGAYGLLDKTRDTCAQYRHAIAGGEDSELVVGYLAQAAGVQRPAIWKRLRRGGVFPPYKCERLKTPPHSAGQVQHRETPPQTYRDPCARCGTRGDIGCGHAPCELRVKL